MFTKKLKNDEDLKHKRLNYTHETGQIRENSNEVLIKFKRNVPQDYIQISQKKNSKNGSNQSNHANIGM